MNKQPKPLAAAPAAEAPGLGAKWRNLAAAAGIVRVPPTVALEPTFFAAWLADYERIDAEIENVLHRIATTFGAMLNEHVALIAQLVAALEWRPGAERALAERCAPAIEAARRGLAVRSCADNEDSASTSFAGVYRSCLGVPAQSAEIAAAALVVWRSYFSLPAISERLAAGCADDGRRMGVIVQPMIEASASGVAFTRDPGGGAGMCLEYVNGLGEALASGRAVGTLVHESELPTLAAPVARMAAGVFSAARSLQPLFGSALDIEWGWDGDAVTILQIRPITGMAAAVRSDRPVFAIEDLFCGEEDRLGPFAPLPDFVHYFRTKRGPLFAFGRARGAKLGRARLVRVNRAGLEQASTAERLEREFPSSSVVLDVSDRVRQQVIPADEITARLSDVLGADGRVRTILLRQFIRGEQGLISRMGDSGSVVCEHSADGLLALNRGTANSRIDVVSREERGPFSLRQANLIRKLTIAAQAQFGSVQLEWVLSGSDLILIDMSPVSDSLHLSGADADIRVISPGVARGPVMAIAESADLLDVSIGPAVSLNGIADTERMARSLDHLLTQVRQFTTAPIVLAARPYAALAPLLPHVAGFVFEGASMLCHLAILLREHRVPAVASPRLYAGLAGRDFASLDASPRQSIDR
jgi:hypothetical protein